MWLIVISSLQQVYSVANCIHSCNLIMDDYYVFPSLIARRWMGPQIKWRFSPQSVSDDRRLTIYVCSQALRGLICSFLLFWLQIAIKPLHCFISIFYYLCFTVMFHRWDRGSLCVQNLYSRLSLSRSPRDSLEYFEISVPRHIRFAELRKTINRTTTFNKWICNLTPEVNRYIKNIVEKRRNCSLGAISPLFNNILIPVVRMPC